MLAENDVASDGRFGTACLFQASGSLLYFDKSIRSEVWHFQFPLTQIYFLHKTLLPFKQDSERIAEAETLFEGQQCFMETINLGEGKLKMPNL